jgi:hypothetical protein
MLPTEFERLLQKSIQKFRIQEKIRIRILGTCNRLFECIRIFLKMCVPMYTHFYTCSIA